MGFFNYFRSSRRSSAALAKERLQIIIAHERAARYSPEFLPRLQKDLLEVIAKYVVVQAEDVKVHLDREGDCEVLELNITLPETGIDGKTR
jgi:cell division topological specificity factor MinE